MVDTELHRLETLGIIKPIQYSEWATPIVPVVKSDGNSVRICGDYKITVNQVSALDTYPLPKIQDLYTKLTGGKTFSKLNLSSAYLQIELAEKSKQYLTINTHRGLYQYNRLAFGHKFTAAIFQRVMNGMFAGMRHVTVYQDDILITGANSTDHLDNLCAVLNKLNESGFQLNLGKCSFMQSSITYLGHVIDSMGLHPSKDRISAITNAPTPRNMKELQSFLGLLNYYSKFLPNTATTLSPLYKLLQKNVRWKWDKEQNNAFTLAKSLLNSSNLLVHYDPNEDILACDASSYGISAILSHKYSDGTEKPISYASRTLSKAERNYSQLDKESLAIIFGVTKFDQYLRGRRFTIITDHRPLITLFSPTTATPQFASPRLIRWCLTLSAYDYNISYKQGAVHANADALSRLPLPQDDSDTTKPGEIINLLELLNSTPITAKQIKLWTSRDPILSKVMRLVSTGDNSVNDPKLTPYLSKSYELSIEDGCLLWGSRVIVRQQGRQQILKQLHENHPGIVKMKGLARSYVWWPGVDKDIEATGKQCHTCQVTRDKDMATPLNPWEYPALPWHRLHIDYLGPWQGKMILVIIDAKTKWIDAYITNSTATNTTTEHLRQSSTHGIPKQIVCDNAAYFTSDEFKRFTGKNNIKHTLIPAYHAASNGLAERAVKTIKNGLKRMSSGTLRTKLSRFLFSYRTTTDSTTCVSPAEALMNRRLRTLFDDIRPNLSSSVIDKQTSQKILS
ncbi:Uncharacterised protein at_DN2364 [Pycnogonum litorale]